MPVFGLDEQRLYSYPPLAQSLLVEEVPRYAFTRLYVLLVEVAQDLPPQLAGRAFGLQRAGLAGARLCPVADQVPGHVAHSRQQDLACGAGVEVALGIVGELVFAEERASLPGALERHVSADARPLDGRYVLHGAVGRVASHPPGPQLPPEGGSPKHVQHGPVLGDLERGD